MISIVDFPAGSVKSVNRAIDGVRGGGDGVSVGRTFEVVFGLLDISLLNLLSAPGICWKRSKQLC